MERAQIANRGKDAKGAKATTEVAEGVAEAPWLKRRKLCPKQSVADAAEETEKADGEEDEEETQQKAKT